MEMNKMNQRRIGVAVFLCALLLFICMTVGTKTAFAEVPDGLKPGPASNTVVWKQKLFNVTNSDGVIQLVLKDGVINEDTYDKGKITGETGKLALQLLDESGKMLSEIHGILAEDSVFNFQSFELKFDDYNKDRSGDFTLGEWVQGEQKYRYKIYTVKDKKISILPVKGEDHIYNSTDFSYSARLVKNGDNGFKTYVYETHTPTEYVEKTYAWDGKQFVQTDNKTLPLVSEKNKKARITYMDLWPQYGISLYTTDGTPESNNHKGYYVFVRGKESYFPDWTANYPLSLKSIVYGLDSEVFGVYFENGSGTSAPDGKTLTFSARKMEPVPSWPWIENNFDMAIYPPGSGLDNAYMVNYNSITAHSPAENVKNIHLLMVNGGMYPNADIQLRNGNTLFNPDVLTDCFGAKVDASKSGKLIITLDGVSIEMTEGVKTAKINGKPADMPVNYMIIGGKPYVPLRFVCEELGCSVSYNGNGSAFGIGKGGTPYAAERADNKTLVSIFAIERPEKSAKALTPDQGLGPVKTASRNAYLDTADYLRLTQRKFDADNKDYDPLNISYTGLTVGRYYVYRLKDFNEMNIYCNKYTGEVFAEHAGLPFIYVGKEFINVSWMYQ